MTKVIPIGTKFNSWTIIDNPISSGSDKHNKYSCRCTCGNIKNINSYNLRNGLSKSCNKGLCNNNIKHGLGSNKLYGMWRYMMKRCYDVNWKDYKHYGARGIKVCEQWHNPINYINDLKEKPDGMELDRIDNNGNYSPENTRWVTHQENINNRRNTIMITYLGDTYSIQYWAKYFKMRVNLIRDRIAWGWNLNDVFNLPLNARHENNARNFLKATYKGEEKLLTEWAEQYSISYPCLKNRILVLKWSIEDALNKKVVQGNKYTPGR